MNAGEYIISSAKCNMIINDEILLLWEIDSVSHLLTIFIANKDTAKAFGARLFGR